MRVLSFYILLATPLAFVLDRITSIGLPLLALPVLGLVLALATYSKTKNCRPSRWRYIIGTTVSFIFILITIVFMVWVFPEANKILEEAFSESEQAPLTEEEKEIVRSIAEESNAGSPPKKKY